MKKNPNQSKNLNLDSDNLDEIIRKLERIKQLLEDIHKLKNKPFSYPPDIHPEPIPYIPYPGRTNDPPPVQPSRTDEPPDWWTFPRIWC